MVKYVDHGALHHLVKVDKTLITDFSFAVCFLGVPKFNRNFSLDKAEKLRKKCLVSSKYFEEFLAHIRNNT